jgi:hypothetical protein
LKVGVVNFAVAARIANDLQICRGNTVLQFVCGRIRQGLGSSSPGFQPSAKPPQLPKDGEGVPETLGLPTHQVIESPTLCLRNPAQTFFGTGIHAPKKVCHNGGFMG